MKRICIVGSGAAGILLLLNFQRAGIDPKRISIIDPFHDGGDLRRKWASVKSNTLWKQLLTAVPPPRELLEPFRSLDPEQPCELRYVIDYLWFCVLPYFHSCSIHTGFVKKVEQDQDTKRWSIYMKGVTTPVYAEALFLTVGSEPKSLDLPFRSIPLHIALDSMKIKGYVKQGDHIALFGTAHSSTLIVQNLIACGARITNFYATPKPFYFDRDGDYDGIKQDAAAIADDILAGKIPNITLVSIHDLGGVIRHTQGIDAVIFAIGFEQRSTLGFGSYNGETGELEGASNGWGFGIAYPNKAPDGIHWDVSVPAFMAHICKQMPNILSSLGIE